MSNPLLQHLALLCAAWLLLPVNLAVGNEFTIRQVTNFGNPITGSRGTPLAVLDDQLLFLAIDSGRMGLYRTDGTDVQLIDNSVVIPLSNSSLSTVESIQFGNELFFSATGPDGRELYATDSQSVRQIANIAPGILNSSPREFQILNGNLLFNGITEDPAVGGGAPVRFFHTNGTTVEQFAVSKVSSAGSSRLGDRLIFDGSPPGGGLGQAYSTDGSSLTAVQTTAGQPLIIPDHITGAGNFVYFVSGGLSDPGIYRTNDGTVAELVSKLRDFTNQTVVASMFEMGDALYFNLRDVTGEIVFYRTEGGAPTEVLRWQPTAGIPTSNPFEEQLLFMDGARAYFSFRLGSGTIYVFDGSSLSPINLGEAYYSLAFAKYEDRVFMNAGDFSASHALFEVVDGNFLPLGPGLENMTLFQGELFGVNVVEPDRFEPFVLYRLENGDLISMGSIAGGPFSFAPTRLVEFDGQLFFNGIDGYDAQLYAIVPVPEPAAVLLAALGVAGMGALRPAKLSFRRTG